MIKIMSFNVLSEQMWKDTENENIPISDNWVDFFSSIVRENDLDIIFLQEVKTINNETSYLCKKLFEKTGQTWKHRDSTLKDGLGNNLTNSIFYKTGENIECKDLVRINPKKYEQYQTDRGNLQIIEYTKNNKTITGLNIHLKYEDVTNIHSKHGDEVRRIYALIEIINRRNSKNAVFAIGDYNYAVRYLKDIMVEESMTGWIIDDEKIFNTQVKEFLTTVTEGKSTNAMDHFIYNPKIVKIQKLLFEDPLKPDYYDISLGVKHVSNPNNPDGIVDVQADDTHIISAIQYNQEISDHYPIIVQIEEYEE